MIKIKIYKSFDKFDKLMVMAWEMQKGEDFVPRERREREVANWVNFSKAPWTDKLMLQIIDVSLWPTAQMGLRPTQKQSNNQN